MLTLDPVSTGEGGRGENDIFERISPRHSKETEGDPEEIEVESNRLERQRQEEKTVVRAMKGKERIRTHRNPCQPTTQITS